MSPLHQQYKEALASPTFSLVIVTGPAGVGKTQIACEYALRHSDKRLILTRPVVGVEGEELGFLPGGLSKKMAPWMRPFADYLGGPDELLRREKRNLLEIAPLGMMRGRTFHDSLIIADEMQNATPIQLKMLLTRIGKNTKMVILGDLEQTDLREKDIGLLDFYHRYFNSLPELKRHITWIELTSNEVLRSPVVSDVLRLYSVGNR